MKGLGLMQRGQLGQYGRGDGGNAEGAVGAQGGAGGANAEGVVGLMLKGWCLCDETATHYTCLSGGSRPHSRVASVTLGAWLAPNGGVPMQIPSQKVWAFASWALGGQCDIFLGMWPNFADVTQLFAGSTQF